MKDAEPEDVAGKGYCPKLPYSACEQTLTFARVGEWPKNAEESPNCLVDWPRSA